MVAAAEKSAQVVVRMTPETLNALRKNAEANERTVAQTVRLAIKQHLEKR